MRKHHVASARSWEFRVTYVYDGEKKAVAIAMLGVLYLANGTGFLSARKE